MKSWICAAALLILVGCSAVTSVPTHLQTQGAAFQASGGAFSATYSGTYTLGSGCALTQFHFGGEGAGSFVHRSIESGSMLSNDHGCNWGGNATLTNSLRPRNSIKTLLQLGNGTPCRPGPSVVKFSVFGGTGKFANATGSGTVVFTCHSDGTYADRWTGTLQF